MIIIRRNCIGGLFAQIMNPMLKILSNLEKYNIYPYFDVKSNYYGIGRNKNIFPHYFVINYDYRNNNNKEFDKTILNQFPYKIENENIVFEFDDLYRKWGVNPVDAIEGNRLFFKYFLVSKSIQCEADNFYEKNIKGKNVLGFHYRGTDKMGSKSKKRYYEAGYIDFSDTLYIIENELDKLKTKDIFIATDDESIIPVLKDKIQNINIHKINYNFTKTDGIPLHRNNGVKTDTDKYNVGKSAIIDMMLLSKCNKLIKYASHLSAFSLIFNPTLNAVRINKTNYKWYPEYLIPYYPKNHFITFATSLNENTDNVHANIYYAGERLIQQAKDINVFSKTNLYTDLDLKNDSEFWSMHEEFIKNNKKGYGFYIWKPYVIRESMKELNDGDVLLYLDAGCEINSKYQDKMNELIEITRREKKVIGCFTGMNESKFTKKDLFIKLDVYNVNFALTPQCQGGTNFFFINKETRDFVDEWYNLACDYHNIDDSESTSHIPDLELPENQRLYQHRHDQSIFSVLVKKYKLHYNCDLNSCGVIEVKRNRSGKSNID